MSQLASSILPAVSASYILSLTFLVITSYNQRFSRYGVIAKVLTSLLFIAIAVVAATISQNFTLFFRMLPAFILCLLGDFFLEYNNNNAKNRFFLPGLVSFLLGHIAFVIAFQVLAPFSLLELIIPCVALLAAFLLTKLKGMNVGKMKPYVLIYAFFVAWLFSKCLFVLLAASNSKEILHAAVILVGSILFFVSDLIILFLYFYDKKPPSLRLKNLFTYYMAQFFLALSLMYFV